MAEEKLMAEGRSANRSPNIYEQHQSLAQTYRNVWGLPPREASSKAWDSLLEKALEVLKSAE